ncbi:MAG TPA: hypothetical protein VK420_12380, partial [Longimicrobium sp.]|nr:hypothetical protein [Longimicrobium sp.]
LAVVLGASPIQPPALPADPVPFEARLAWEPRPVRHPVQPGELLPEPPFVPVHALEVRGEVVVSPSGGAAFWLRPLERVRVHAPPGAPVFFARARGAADGPASSRALVELKAEPVSPGVFVLGEPPGPGSAWFIGADAEAKVRVERPIARGGELIWEELRREVLRFVDGQASPPPLPYVSGAEEVSAELELGEAVAEALAKAQVSARARRAFSAWRKAHALRRLEELRPLSPSFFDLVPLDAAFPGAGPVVALPEGNAEREYRLLSGATSAWEGELSGAGSLRVEVRPLFTATEGGPRLAELRVERDGRPLASHAFVPEPARRVEGPAGAFPLPEVLGLPSGERVGWREELRVGLPPGRHRYRIHLSGGPLLARVTVAQRRPRSTDVLAGRASWASWLSEAEAALADERSPAASLVRVLVAGTRGEAAPPVIARADVERLPRLAGALLAVAVAEERRGAGEDVGPALEVALRAIEGDASGHGGLRARLARVLIASGRVHQARRLLESATGAPTLPELLALADVYRLDPLEVLPRSREISVLHRAWQQAPFAPEVRARYLDAWARSTWTQLPPEDPASRAEGLRWLDVEPPEPDTVPGHDPDTFWPLSAGRVHRVVA